MKMFEYGGDISVFHGALISSMGKAAEFLEINENEQFSKEGIYMMLKKEQCMKISHIIARAFHEVSSEFESRLSSNDLNCRVHASAFHAAMSLGRSNDNESYFESLDGVLPNISWTLYFELVKAFQWNKCFIECITGLPLDVARSVVELAVKHFEKDPLDSDTFLLDCCKEITFKHSYSFVHNYLLPKGNQNTNGDKDGALSQEETPTSLQLMVKLNAEYMHKLWFSIYAKDEESVTKVFKLGITTLLAFFDCVRKSKYEDFTSSFMELNNNKIPTSGENEFCERAYRIPVKKEEIQALLKVTGDFLKEACEILSSDRCKAFIISRCKELSNVHSREKTSFDSLFLQFIGYLKEFVIMCSSMEFSDDLQTLILSFSKIMAAMDGCELGKNIWFSKVHSLLLWSTDVSLDKYDVIMEDIMKRSNCISEESILEFLEQNIDLLCKPTGINIVTDIILNNEVLQKQRIIKILLDAFQNLKTEEQEAHLSALINSHGVTKIFKTDDFDTQVIHFLNQIIKEKAFVSKKQGQVLMLCLQSPYDFIRQIIVQGIKNCGKISALAQVLKVVPFVCNYKVDCHSPQLLTKCLCDVIGNEELSKQQEENLVTLIQVLLQYKNKDEYIVLSPEEVLIWCVLPHLQVSSDTSLLDFSISILQAVINKIKFGSEKIRKVAVVWCLYQILEHYTKERNGEKRQVIIDVINLLMSQDISFTEKDIRWLEAYVKGANPIWYLWLQHTFFKKDIEKEQLENINLVELITGGSFGLMKEMCCAAVHAKLKKLSHDVRYPYLIISLSKVLLHSTSEEWMFCFDVIEANMEELQTSPIITSFSKDIKNSNKNVAKTIHSFVDALLLIQSTGLLNIQWHYIISCFNKLVKHTMDQVESDKMLIGFVSCEICRLANVLDIVYTTDIVAALLDTASCWKESYSTEPHLKEVLLNAIDTISSFVAAENFKKIFN